MTLIWLFAGFLTLGFLLAAARGFANARPEALKTVIRYTLAGIGVAVGLWLLFTGRAMQAVLPVVLLAPLIQRWWNQYKARQTFGRPAGAGTGQASTVETAWLRMRLDHDSGQMSGTVLKGRFKGRELHAMTLSDILDLRQDLRADDPQSVALIEAFLDRAFGADWREAEGPGEGYASGEGRDTSSARMTPAEALAVLGLQEGASETQIRDAHRRLMMHAHPDRGGSTYLAAKINQARDVLLGD